MSNLLERTVASVGERMVLLAPPNAAGHDHFRNVAVDEELRGALVRQMQRLRGDVYLKDSAISPEQLIGGRHETPEDERSWHLLMLDRHHQVTACIWYMEHDNGVSVDSLRARSCPLAVREEWSAQFHDAVGGELECARRLGVRFAEVGGWAVAPEHRRTSEGLLLVLAAFSLARISGDALVVTTATVRHASSTILRRLGGAFLSSAKGPLPTYFDPRYNCEMELLRFDSRRPASKFASLIERLKEELSVVQVVSSQALAGVQADMDTGPVSLPVTAERPGLVSGRPAAVAA